MVNARSLARGDKGTIFVSTRLLDKIYAITEKNGKREVKPLFSGLLRPNGVAFRNGTLYIAELNKISKVEKIEDNLDNAPKPVVIYDDLPSDEPHGWKYLTVGPDNKLYFQVGAPCNICMPSERHAQIRRILLRCSSWSVAGEVVEDLRGIYAVLSVGLGVGHDAVQDVGRAFTTSCCDRKHNKPALGPVGDSLDDLKPPFGGTAA